MASAPLATVGKALQRWHWLVWGVAGLATGTALGAASVRTPTYQATTLMIVDESQNVSQGFDIALQADQYLEQRYISMATSQAVLARVCSQEGGGCSPTALSRQVSATATRATGEIAITASAGSPESAVQLADDVARATLAENKTYITSSQATQRQLLQKQLDQLNQQMTTSQVAIQAAHTANKSDSGPLAQLNLLQNQYQTTYGLLQALDVKQTQLTSGFTIEQLATAPTKPADPDPVRYVLVGLVGGLTIGFLLALLAERFRDRIVDGAELAEVTGSELVLAVDYREAPVLLGSYGLLSPRDQSEEAGGAQLLLIAAGPDVPVDDLAMDLAEAAASEHRRVLVVPSRPGRGLREVDDHAAGRQLQARPRPSGPRGVDLTIRCASPLSRPSQWLKPSAGQAILVAARNRTRFDEARRTTELLRHLGLEPVAAVLLTRVAQVAEKVRPPVQEADSVEARAPEQEAPESETPEREAPESEAS
jgi:capsular polysaccharide biosynthesis protein